MRIAYGPIPPSNTLLRPDDGWTPLRELPPARFTIAAILLTIPLVVPGLLVLHASRNEVRTLFADHPAALVGFVLALVAMVPVHEAIHALAYFKDVRSPNLIAGVWPRRGMCYVLYDAPLPRNRVLFMSAAPFLVLTLAPLCCIPWLDGPPRALLLLFALLHTTTCGGDFLVLWRLVRQVPSRAWVQNNGWQTYWTERLKGGSGVANRSLD
jgi:hypothetical protein